MNFNKDYYAVLGVSPSIDDADLAVVHRTLLKKFHPDVYAGPKSTADRITQEINEAYEVLGNAASRRKYDGGRNIQQRLSVAYTRRSGPSETDRRRYWIDERSTGYLIWLALVAALLLALITLPPRHL
jgi:curved DNA-binding protein CbpA